MSVLGIASRLKNWLWNTAKQLGTIDYTIYHDGLTIVSSFLKWLNKCAYELQCIAHSNDYIEAQNIANEYTVLYIVALNWLL